MPSCNDFTKACDASPFGGARMKRAETDRAAWCAKAAHLPHFDKPVFVTFRWVEPTRGRRRDHDNVAFAKKFILDGLILAGVIPDDSPSWVVGFADRFSYNRDPYILVTISDEEP